MFDIIKHKLMNGEALTVAIFGDSISDVDRIPGWFGGASCREKHYAQIFRRLVVDKWETEQILTHYAGFCGNNTYEAHGRIYLLKPVMPDMVVVAIGANDFGVKPLSDSQSAKALDLIISDCRTQLNAAVITMAASHGGPSWDQWPETDSRIAAQKQVCAVHGVPFVDTSAEMKRQLTEGRPWTTWFSSDADAHPHDGGMHLWGEMLFSTFNRVLGGKA